MIVLDTHAAVWFAGGVKLKAAAARLIQSNSAHNRIYLSAISAWEIGMLVCKGRLQVGDDSVATYVGKLFDREGVVELPVTKEIAELAARLPEDFHGDPADRIIVASAVSTSATLITRDSRILAYAKRTRFVSAIEC